MALFMPANKGSYDDRSQLATVLEITREISRQTDPQEMVRRYAERMRDLIRTDRALSLSRRGLSDGWFRITRSSTWPEEINPWKEKDRLPLLQGGVLAELIYGNEPRYVEHMAIADDDPAIEYLGGMESLVATPLFDGGEALNMVVLLNKDRPNIDIEFFSEWVLMSNLFGRATHNLVLSDELQQAYTLVDQELQRVAAVQRSLLPDKLPEIPSMGLAAHYQTSQRAGGDYYDFFPLPDGSWGILIADVAGHGPGAAVLMAITHSIAHAAPEPPVSPGRMLAHINQRLTGEYTGDSNTFVTGFYGVYQPKGRKLRYAIAGHPPPRVKRCEDGSMFGLDHVGDLPLGIIADLTYEEAEHVLRPADQIVFYTDGITEAVDPLGDMYGVERLDAVLRDCRPDADELISAVLADVDRFTDGAPPTDDRTMLVAKVW